MITPQVAVVFVVFASVMLLALYFFLSHIFFLFLVSFCPASPLPYAPQISFSMPWFKAQRVPLGFVT